MNSLEQLEKYAKEKFIPIARKQTTEFMVNLIKENNYKSFFEVIGCIALSIVVMIILGFFSIILSAILI